MTRRDQRLDAVVADHQHVGIDEARKLGIPWLETGQNLVAMRIGRVEPPLGLKEPHRAVHPPQRLDRRRVQRGEEPDWSDLPDDQASPLT